MKQNILVNIYEAKTTLSALIQAVLHGQRVTIARAGVPVADLVPHQNNVQSKKRKLGLLDGKAKIKRDFDRLPEDLIKLMRGE